MSAASTLRVVCASARARRGEASQSRSLLVRCRRLCVVHSCVGWAPGRRWTAAQDIVVETMRAQGAGGQVGALKPQLPPRGLAARACVCKYTHTHTHARTHTHTHTHARARARKHTSLRRLDCRGATRQPRRPRARPCAPISSAACEHHRLGCARHALADGADGVVPGMRWPPFSAARRWRRVAAVRMAWARYG